MFGLEMNVSADPLEHVLQHSLKKCGHGPGKLTPKGVITVFSDQISMLILAALLLMIFVPIWVKKRRGAGEVGEHGPYGVR